jgi:hypothetical protein
MRFAWGQLRLAQVSGVGALTRSPASCDWLGHRYEWKPLVNRKGALAIDVERIDTPLPDDVLCGDFGREDFLRAWTRLETVAKLMNQPILVALRRWPLSVPVMDRDELIEVEGVRLQMRSGLWPARNLVFTCGHRLD